MRSDENFHGKCHNDLKNLSIYGMKKQWNSYGKRENRLSNHNIFKKKREYILLVFSFIIFM